MHGETPHEALMRAAQSAMDAVRDACELRTVDQLEAGAVAVRVHHEWYGYEGLDAEGRMILWHRESSQPFFYGPSTDEPFVWHDLIGGRS